jgi:hypothetical protein
MLTPCAYQPDRLSGRSWGNLILRLVSRLICFQRLSMPHDSYWTMPLVKQSIHQRCVQSGPLVLRSNPLKFPIVHSGYKPNCLTRVILSCSILKTLSIITDGTDYIFTLLLSLDIIRGPTYYNGLKFILHKVK